LIARRGLRCCRGTGRGKWRASTSGARNKCLTS
jgi:hypothetical protein